MVAPGWFAARAGDEFEHASQAPCYSRGSKRLIAGLRQGFVIRHNAPWHSRPVIMRQRRTIWEWCSHGLDMGALLRTEEALIAREKRYGQC